MIAVGALLALALLIWALPLLSGSPWSAILAELRSAAWWTLPTIALLSVAALAVDAAGLAAVMPALGYRHALRIDAIISAVGLAIPGGGAIALGLLYLLGRRRGLPRAEIIGGVALGSTVDATVVGLLPVVGLAAWALSGRDGLSDDTALLLAILAAITLCALITLLTLAASPALGRLAESLARTIGSLGVGPDTKQALAMAGDVVAARDRALSLLRRDGLRIIGAPVLVRVLQCAMLLVAVAGAGAGLSTLRTIAVFALGRLLALIPLTPGGTGIAEAGSAGAMAALGADAASAAAATILMMLGTLAVPLLAGLAAVLISPRSGRWRSPRRSR